MLYCGVLWCAVLLFWAGKPVFPCCLAYTCAQHYRELFPFFAADRPLVVQLGAAVSALPAILPPR